MNVAVIIPALNEQDCIGPLVAGLARTGAGRIVVVDNGSTDRTSELARVAGAVVVSQPERGYGNACHAGVDASEGADVLVFMDGDLSDDPSELPRLLAPIEHDQADLVLGTRTHVEPGALTPQQVAGNRVALWLIALLLRRRLGDLPSYKAVRRETLVALRLKERTYGWTTELLVKALRHNVRIVEVPTRYRKRGGGRSKVAGTLRGTLGAGYHMLKVVLRYAL